MVRTTPEERREIREVIAGVHNAVFRDRLDPDDIELTQLLSEDNEMDVYPPYFGVNIKQWRHWGPVKKLEVIFHELAHIEDPDDNHRPSFWERLVELMAIAEDHWEEVQDAVGADVRIAAVRRKIIDEVHEDIIDRRMDDVDERQEWLRERFGMRSG